MRFGNTKIPKMNICIFKTRMYNFGDSDWPGSHFSIPKLLVKSRQYNSLGTTSTSDDSRNMIFGHSRRIPGW